jgi:hypothetical protein
LRETLEQRARSNGGTAEDSSSSSSSSDDDSDDDDTADAGEGFSDATLSLLITSIDLIYCNPSYILKAWHDAGKYGLLPLMAMSSSINIGTLCSGKL